ncbi:MAG: hypothetical protein AAF533_20620 [Acidobacteriota bacterium]
MRNPRQVSLTLTILLVGLLSLTSCEVAPQDDNGERSFVVQATTDLLGRPVKSEDEVELLTDVSVLFGRDATLELLQVQPEYVPYWTDVLFEDLRLQRTGDREHPEECYEVPSSADLAGSSDLADALRSHGAGDSDWPLPESFNVVDVAHSAIRLQDLTPLYRAHLYPLLMQAGVGDETDRRQRMADEFARTYFDRQVDCMNCHYTTWSTTDNDGIDDADGWDRFDPIAMLLEDTALSAYGDELLAVFRTDVRRDTSGGAPVGRRPWNGSGGGMTLDCVTRLTYNGADIDDLFEGFETPLSLPDGEVPAEIAEVTGNRLTVYDLEDALRVGFQQLHASPPPSTLFVEHGQGAQDDFGNALASLPGKQAAAYLVAAKIVNDIWEQLFGARLTIAHHYPRNSAQRFWLTFYTEHFINSGYSLQSLQRAMMGSNFYNRAAPAHGGGDSAYEIPMVFDPWVERDPRDTDAELLAAGIDPDSPAIQNNGQGDLVHRHSVPNLVSQASSALEWPEYDRYPNWSYPSTDFITATGGYLAERVPGSSGVDFQSFLAWQDAVGHAPNYTGDDWLEDCAQQAGFLDPWQGLPTSTIGEVLQRTKVRILGDWRLHDAFDADVEAEAAALETLVVEVLGEGHSLDTGAHQVSGGWMDLEELLRAYAGVLLSSPQFLLAGVQPPESETPVPSLDAYCDDPPCTYEDLCPIYRQQLAQLGYHAQCQEHALVLYTDVTEPDDDETPGAPGGGSDDPDTKLERRALAGLCPDGLCGFVPLERTCPEGTRPSSDCVSFRPRRDPTCRGASPCAQDPPVDGREGHLVAVAEGAVVTEAVSVMVVEERGVGRRRALRAGEVLSAGLVLELTERSRFVAEAPLRRFELQASRPQDSRSRSQDEALLRELDLLVRESAAEARREPGSRWPQLVTTATERLRRASEVDAERGRLRAGRSVRWEVLGTAEAGFTITRGESPVDVLLAARERLRHRPTPTDPREEAERLRRAVRENPAGTSGAFPDAASAEAAARRESRTAGSEGH